MRRSVAARFHEPDVVGHGRQRHRQGRSHRRGADRLLLEHHAVDGVLLRPAAELRRGSPMAIRCRTRWPSTNTSNSSEYPSEGAMVTVLLAGRRRAERTARVRRPEARPRAPGRARRSSPPTSARPRTSGSIVSRGSSGVDPTSTACDVHVDPGEQQQDVARVPVQVRASAHRLADEHGVRGPLETGREQRRGRERVPAGDHDEPLRPSPVSPGEDPRDDRSNARPSGLRSCAGCRPRRVRTSEARRRVGASRGRRPVQETLHAVVLDVEGRRVLVEHLVSPQDSSESDR